jgi:hypothetical protein
MQGEESSDACFVVAEEMAAWPVVGLSYSLVRSFSPLQALSRRLRSVSDRCHKKASEPAHNVNPPSPIVS